MKRRNGTADNSARTCNTWQLASDIEPFEIAGNLHNANTHDIGRDQHQHLVEGSCAAEEINQLSCHFSLKPGACKKSQIIDETGNRNKKRIFHSS